jgi:signal transduction histidine kinase
MSAKLSTPLPQSLRGEVEDHALPVDLADAFGLLVRQRMFGLAWTDRTLVAQRCIGELAAFIPIGQPVTQSVLPLVGLDDVLMALMRTPETPFEMPNISFASRDDSNPRLNLHVYWLPDRQQFMLLVSKVFSTGDLEIGLAQQVRKRMIAEAELAQKSKALAAANSELTRANRDLAEFAYMISHDLKAPLRAMRYFVDDLEQALDGGDGHDPRLHAGNIRTQSRRMTQMLTDLLAYSKIGRQSEAFGIVDTSALVHEIVASMPRPARMMVEIGGTWPTLETYPAPLDLVLRNLIGNAIAHHDRPEGLVRVSCRAVEDAYEFEIADDGPGIPPEWHEAIFLPFRTVGEDRDAEHSGIGLALVRRTAESVGATLTLESDPGRARGATFRVRWPAAIAP